MLEEKFLKTSTKTIRSFFDTKAVGNIEKVLLPIFQEYFSKEFQTDTRAGRKNIKNYLKSLAEVYERNTNTFFGRTLTENLTNFQNAIAKHPLNAGKEKELNYRFIEVEEKIRLALSDTEKFDREIHVILDRLALTLFVTYSDMKDKIEKIEKMSLDSNSKTEYHAKVYDHIFKKFEEKIASLLPHQISEPENFLEIGKRTNFMLKAMRTGKTLSFVFSGLLKMLA